jgi:hypothetical protein
MFLMFITVAISERIMAISDMIIDGFILFFFSLCVIAAASVSEPALLVRMIVFEFLQGFCLRRPSLRVF